MSNVTDGMSDYLAMLESAISDVGFWTWWTADLPGSFQVEFSGTQLWNPPRAEGAPPSSQIALRFRKPRLVLFLTMSGSMPEDWHEKLQRDEIEPFRIDYDAFTLTSTEVCARLVANAKAARSLVPDTASISMPAAQEAFLGFKAGSVGVVIASESVGVFNRIGELDQDAVLESGRRWWSYWREYWQRKHSSNPLPRDYACEVTIPAAPEG